MTEYDRAVAPPTAYVHVEPGHAQRPAFASWGLSQDPPLQTASASGWDVPVELYPSVPPELLEGAYVDGYAVQGVVAPEEVPAPPEPPAKPVVEVPSGGPRTQEARRSRKSAARKTPISGSSGYSPAELLGGSE